MTSTYPPVESANTILRSSARIDLRLLTAIETEEEIILRGTVSSYYLKQLAQETVLPLLGERRLRNELAVV
jgi:hypothetical protein